jgi:hypothetical protein
MLAYTGIINAVYGQAVHALTAYAHVMHVRAVHAETMHTVCLTSELTVTSRFLLSQPNRLFCKTYSSMLIQLIQSALCKKFKATPQLQLL